MTNKTFVCTELELFLFHFLRHHRLNSSAVFQFEKVKKCFHKGYTPFPTIKPYISSIQSTPILSAHQKNDIFGSVWKFYGVGVVSSPRLATEKSLRRCLLKVSLNFTAFTDVHHRNKNLCQQTSSLTWRKTSTVNVLEVSEMIKEFLNASIPEKVTKIRLQQTIYSHVRKKERFICELILERYMELRDTQKQLKITSMVRTKGP